MNLFELVVHLYWLFWVAFLIYNSFLAPLIIWIDYKLTQHTNEIPDEIVEGIERKSRENSELRDKEMHSSFKEVVSTALRGDPRNNKQAFDKFRKSFPSLTIPLALLGLSEILFQIISLFTAQWFYFMLYLYITVFSIIAGFKDKNYDNKRKHHVILTIIKIVLLSKILFDYFSTLQVNL